MAPKTTHDEKQTICSCGIFLPQTQVVQSMNKLFASVTQEEFSLSKIQRQKLQVTSMRNRASAWNTEKWFAICVKNKLFFPKNIVWWKTKFLYFSKVNASVNFFVVEKFFCSYFSILSKFSAFFSFFLALLSFLWNYLNIKHYKICNWIIFRLLARF